MRGKDVSATKISVGVGVLRSRDRPKRSPLSGASFEWSLSLQGHPAGAKTLFRQTLNRSMTDPSDSAPPVKGEMARLGDGRHRVERWRGTRHPNSLLFLTQILYLLITVRRFL